MAQHLLQIAKKLAHDAGRMALDYQKRNFKIETKGHHKDLVTDADRACEKLIVETIKKNFPDHTIMSEESELIHGDSDYKWIIDPIDGTTNFAHGSQIFGVSIAIAYKGKPIIGVIEIPALKETFWAKEGQGAHVNNRRVMVSQADKLEVALLSSEYPYRGEHERWDMDRKLNKELREIPVRGIRETGSAAFDMAFVAAGRLDGFHAYNLQAWDIAAGKVLIEEAGGVVTNMDGSMLAPKRAMILATNGLIHQEMLDHIKKAGGDKL